MRQKRSMYSCSAHVAMHLAAWHAARGRSHRAILAPQRIFIKTFAAMGWSTPDRVGGPGSLGQAAAAPRP
eukprot:3956886-Pyramimonas_sp.AAC.1